jgi:type II secretory pathway component PulK
VQALVIIAGLLALMAMLVAQQRVTLEATQNQLRQRRAETAAKSAVAVAMATLQSANANIVTQNDDWAVLGDYGNQEFEIGESGSGITYRMQILDAGSRINVNTAPETQLQLLPLTEEQRDSLLDWREATTAPRPQGAKDEYYNGLPQPYNAKLGRLTTFSELLLIRGWTAMTLYSPPGDDVVTTAIPPQDAEGNPIPLVDLLTVESGMPNTRADGQPRTNIGQGNMNAAALVQLGIDAGLADQIANRAPYATLTDLFNVPGLTPIAMQVLLDDVTTIPANRLEGRVNINMASQAVFESVLGIPQDVASSIVTRQTNGGFQSLGELANVPGVTGPILAQIADSIGIGSDTWIVRAYGQSGGVGVAIEAVIGLRNERIQIVTFERLNNTSIPVWWNWEPEATSVVPAGSAVTGGTTAGGATSGGGGATP